MRPLALRAVLAATDLSDSLLPALRTAAELARLAGASLDVVHAAREPRADAEAALAAQLRAAGCGPGTPCGAHIEVGAPAAVINDTARRTNADVIVLGPHKPDRPHGLGSTADAVVRDATVPCLVVPVGLALPLGSVLVPVDVSDTARGALAVALTWASALRRREPDRNGQTSILVLHVAPGPPGTPEVGDSERIRREVDAVRSRLAGAAGVEVHQHIELGHDPAEAIHRHADAGFDLIVLGTRGRNAAVSAELGSVSSAVVRRTSRPVLLVPPAVWRDFGEEPLP